MKFRFGLVVRNSLIVPLVIMSVVTQTVFAENVVVDSSGDAVDNCAPGHNTGSCTLRTALIYAAAGAESAYNITFDPNVAQIDLAGAIAPDNNNPAKSITVDGSFGRALDPVILNGGSINASPIIGTMATNYNITLRGLKVDGTSGTAQQGIKFESSDNLHLENNYVINVPGDAVSLGNIQNSEVSGNNIGMNEDYFPLQPNTGNGISLYGINGATSNVSITSNNIGGDAGSGILLDGSINATLSNIEVANNLIGTYAGFDWGNGIGITVGHSNEADAFSINGLNINHNLISYNDGDGIKIYQNVGGGIFSGVVIDANFIGTPDNGLLTPYPNNGNGINIEGNRSANGGDLTISGNTISGNSSNGINVGAGVLGLSIYGNKIGVNGEGVTAMGNSMNGISLYSPGEGDTIQIGDPLHSPNIISGNGGDGVEINQGGTGIIKIQNNHIGTDITGLQSLSQVGGAPLANNSNAIDANIPQQVCCQLDNGQGGPEVISGYTLIVGGDGEGQSDANEGNIIVNGNSHGTTGVGVYGTLSSLRIAGNMIGVLGDGVTIDGNRNGIETGNWSTKIADGIYIFNNVFGGSYRTAMDLHVADPTPLDLPIEIKGNYIGIAQDGMTNLHSGGPEIEAGAITFGGANNLYLPQCSDPDYVDTDFSCIGDGNIVSYIYHLVNLEDPQNGAAPITFSGGTRTVAAYVYGNIFGLARNPITGIYSVNAGNENTDISLGGGDPQGGLPKIHTIVIGAAPQNGEQPSQRRNVISGGYDSGGVEAKVIVGTMCNSLAQEGDENYCLSSDHRAHVTIVNNYVGTDFSGNAIDDGGVDGGDGILIAGGDDINIGWSGGDSFNEQERNVISGRYGTGITGIANLGMGGSPVGVMRILGNYIGLNAAGTTAVPNGTGINIVGGTVYIGYTGPSGVGSNPATPIYGKNVISGNDTIGISVKSYIWNGEPVSFSNYVLRIVGNYIGTNAAGTAGIPNGSSILLQDPVDIDVAGIFISDLYNQATDIVIGGTNVMDRNVISGNYGAGIMLAGVNGVQVLGNYIGLNANGDAAIPNLPYGAELIAFFEGLFGPCPYVGTGVSVVDWGYDTIDGLLQSSIANVIIQNNYISGNHSDGILALHGPNTGEAAQFGTVIGGLGQNWSDGYIKDNVFGFAANGITPISNGGYGLHVVDTLGETNITGLMIGGSNNSFETGTNYGMYLEEIASDALFGGYDYLSAHNDFSNNLLGWMAIVNGVTFHNETDPEGPVCGNSVVEDGEQCDDGNAVSGDSCSATCQTEGGGVVIVVPPVVIPPPPPEITCPTGYTMQGNSCVKNQIVCSTGFTQQGEQCIPITCPVGQRLSGNYCIPVVSCQAGYTLQGGQCVQTEVKKEIKKETLPAGIENNTITTSTGTANVGTVVVPTETAKSRTDCTSLLGSADSNGNSIPDCLEPTTIIETQIDKPSKEAADELVFGLTGSEPTLPTIVNLDGKVVDQRPLVLVTYKPNKEVSLLLEEAETGKKLVVKNELQSDPVTGKSSFEKVTVVEEVKTKYTDKEVEIGKTTIDKEYKGQISIENPLPVGKYYAYLIDKDGVKGNKVMFEVAKTDMGIKDLKVVEDKYDINPKVQPLVKSVLSVIEKTDNSGRFIAEEYQSYKESQNKDRKYRILARLDSKDKAKKIVYFTYKSVIYSSVALSDVSDQGETINVPVPEYIPRNEKHTLTMYVSDLNKTKISSKKSIQFRMY